MSGWSGQESLIGQLKSDFAFDQIMTNTYQVNSAFMQINQKAYNQYISMQQGHGISEKRKDNLKHPRIQFDGVENFQVFYSKPGLQNCLG